MDRPEQTLSAVLDAGELLLTSGAEAARVEDTMRRLARAYGFVRADVLTITASMAVTVRTADGQVITQTRRILRRGTDMRCIEAVNELSREVCVNPIPPEELHARLEAIRTAPDKLRCRLPLAYLITSGSFAVFFGGTWRDGIAAMLCSVRNRVKPSPSGRLMSKIIRSGRLAANAAWAAAQPVQAVSWL